MVLFFIVVVNGIWFFSTVGKKSLRCLGVSIVLVETGLAKKQWGRVLYKKGLARKKYFFHVVKNFPQEIENTREIIQNMSEIF